MNEQLKEQLVKFLGAILTGIEKGADFAIEQAPLVVQEYVAWQRVTTTVWLLVGAILIVAALRVTFWRALPAILELCRQAREKHNSVPESAYVPHGVALALSGVGFIVGAIATAENLTYCLKAWFAPRILVIEWIKSLL
jgi:hypothetical protein